MTIVANIQSRIDELTDEITELQDKFNTSEYPKRHNLRVELSKRRIERLRLRELNDEMKIGG